MLRHVVVGLSALVLLASPSVGRAQTLKQRQTMSAGDGQLVKAAKNASDICGTSFAASFDWPTFVAADTVGDTDSLSNPSPASDLCSVLLVVLHSMCQDAQARQAIMAKIKAYRCAYQAGPTPTMSIDAAGTFELQASYEAYHHMDHATLSAFVQDWLDQDRLR